MLRLFSKLLIFFIFGSLFSCRTSKIDTFSTDRENVTLKLLNNNRFSYVYYKLAGMNYEDSKKLFCIGTYLKLSKNIYELYPDTFDNKSVEVSVNSVENNYNGNTHIRINTNIYPDRSNEYRIHLISDSLTWFFTGLRIDTVIDGNFLRNFIIEIILPEFYITGHPSAIYKSLVSEPIKITECRIVDVTLPITLDYFYYQNIGVIRLKDMGNYLLFLKDGRKIKKAKKIK
jgi:hypothetical protein